MPPRERARRPPSAARANPDPLIRLQVFLNVPYDRPYEPLFLAAIAGTCGQGLEPRTALELPAQQGRLDRILQLIRRCRYSIHDLSSVRLVKGVPRFNMPFELGLAVATRSAARHDWWILEARRYRLQRSLSDLAGFDPQIHNGRPLRMLQIIDDMFSRPGKRAVPLVAVLDLLERQAPAVRRRYGSLYTKGGFRSLVFTATTFCDQLRKSPVEPEG